MRQHYIEMLTHYQNAYDQRITEINNELVLPPTAIADKLEYRSRQSKKIIKAIPDRIKKFQIDLQQDRSSFSMMFTEFLDTNFMSHHYYARSDTSDDTKLLELHPNKRPDILDVHPSTLIHSQSKQLCLLLNMDDDAHKAGLTTFFQSMRSFFFAFIDFLSFF